MWSMHIHTFLIFVSYFSWSCCTHTHTNTHTVITVNLKISTQLHGYTAAKLQQNAACKRVTWNVSAKLERITVEFSLRKPFRWFTCHSPCIIICVCIKYTITLYMIRACNFTDIMKWSMFSWNLFYRINNQYFNIDFSCEL